MERNRLKIGLSALIPILLLVLLLLIFLKYGPIGVFKASVPPIEEVFIQKVTFSPEHIVLDVINDGPDPVTIAQLLVNEVYWQFDMEPSQTLNPLQRGRIDIVYPWVEGDVERITLVSRNGVTFETEVDVATVTPTFSFLYFKSFVLLGVYVGVIPVLLGLLWFPFLTILRGKGYDFLLTLTVGLLVFLGFDALSESFGLLQDVPSAYNGVGIIVIGLLLAILSLSAVSYKTQDQRKLMGEQYQALAWGYLIALGIGLHNLGEGLAIGSAYAIGEIALGSTLVIGFMIHNVTEGVAIIAPLTRTHQQIKRFLFHLIMMGLLAGAPTILGTLIGGFAYSAAIAILFLSIGAGAIFDVSFDILHHMAKGQWLSIFTATNALGFLTGLSIMYVTGFLVVG